MSNTTEEQIGEVCKAIQESVDSLKHLPQPVRERVKEWLEDCASKAKSSKGHTASVFNNEIERFYCDVERRIGHKLKRERKVVG
jgi:hypothetical protein